MKKTSYAAVPWRNDCYRVAAILLAASAGLLFLLNLKQLAATYWRGGSAEAITALIGFVFLLFSASWIYRREKTTFRFAVFLLFAGLLCLAKRFDFGLLWICVLILLAVTLGFPQNRPLKFWFFRRIPTPWLCLLGSLLGLWIFLTKLGDFFDSTGALKGLGTAKLPAKMLMPYYGQVLSALALMAIVAAVIMLLFFTQTVPRDKFKDFQVTRTVKQHDSLLIFFAAMIMLTDIVLAIFSGRLGYGLADGLQGAFAWVLCLVTALLLWQWRRENTMLLMLVFLFLSYQSHYFTAAGGLSFAPNALFLLLLISAAGFAGNETKVEKGEFKLTIFDLTALAAILLWLIPELRDHVREICRMIDAQPHKLTAAYRSMAVKTVLASFAFLLRVVVIALLVLGKKQELTNTTVIAKLGTFFARLTDYRRNFQRNVGSKICRLAYVLSTIFLVLMFISLFLFALSAVLWIGNGCSDVFLQIFGRVMELEAVFMLYFLGAAVVFFFNALFTWFTYAGGQVTTDLRFVAAKHAASGTPKAVDAETCDRDVPEL